jgi:hypothetical protein
MKTVNSISGGKTSGYIAANYPANYNVFSLVCIDDHDCRPKDNAIVDYVNMKLEKFIPEYGEFIATAEDDATLYAMMDLEQFIGKDIIWVRGMSFDDVIDKGTQTRLPSWARRYCTEKLKLRPIFDWWFNDIGEKCNMRIGFRFDEFERIERFFNNSDPTNFEIPVRCSTRGQRRQTHETFNWRYCSFPLIRDGITHQMVKDFWNDKGYVGGNLFNDRRKIVWPEIGNCVGWFHKKPETLCIMANMHLEKMQWFANQEKKIKNEKGMGMWLDSRVPYQTFIDNRDNWILEMMKDGGSCDSGGCHD